MSRKNGQLRTCDKCGKTIFLEHIGDSERDGGFTRWNNFEKAEGWEYRDEYSDLCPDCVKLFDELRIEFIEKFKTI